MKSPSQRLTGSYVRVGRSCFRFETGRFRFESTADQEALREMIFHEQRVEVAFENHRWYQLLRTGRAIEVMTAHGNAEKARLQANAAKLKQVCHLSNEAYNILPYKLLFPLPERDCRLNGFENNPGWY
ncbi:MAG: RagB/SusD family nutrient uptake outer membrane protein [Tannerella sp.]|nr:RagB/SusD family nutrient uptake outer membrane protein [Tannerella sp.]